MSNLYRVTDSVDTIYAEDINQFADAFNAQNDIGSIQLFQPISVPSAPTVTINATAGNLNGAYLYKVAYLTGSWKGQVGTGTLNTSGNTSGGTVSSSVSPVSQQVNISAIPVGGTGVVARMIYRTKAGGSTYYQLVQLNDNTTTTYTDNIADTSLTVVMPISNTTGSSINNLVLTGNPTAPTPSASDNSTNVATTATVKQINQITAKSANATLLLSESGIINVTTSTSVITITLPTATTVQVSYLIKKVDSGIGTVSITTTSSQTIDGLTTRTILNQYGYIRVVSDGSNWVITDISNPAPYDNSITITHNLNIYPDVLPIKTYSAYGNGGGFGSAPFGGGSLFKLINTVEYIDTYSLKVYLSDSFSGTPTITQNSTYEFLVNFSTDQNSLTLLLK